MKVLVFDAATQEPVGIGDLCRREDLVMYEDDYAGNPIPMTIPDHPVIVMEDGEILRGIECWWCPA